jgi:hypothetical protein
MFDPDSNLAIHLSLYDKSKKSKKPSHKKAFKNMRSLIRNKLHKNYWDYLNNMLDPEKDNNSKKF